MTTLRQPRALLYSIAAGIGGTGLDQVAAESLRAAQDRGFLGRAIAYDTRLPDPRIELLRHHPVKLLSPLGREHYLGAKKHALDHRTAHHIETGRYDLLHTWSGDARQSLRAAHARGIPTLLEIPTWHRNKGKIKKDKTWSEIQRDAAPFPRSLLNRLLITRQQVMEEYTLATLLLVLSEKARETFLTAGIPPEKLFLTSRGVDPHTFSPAPAPPEKFRAIFIGSLSRRKGIHHLLDVWRRLALPDAELILVGHPTRDIAPLLADAPANVTLRGFLADPHAVAAELRRATLHIFPSECEGSAKATYEASACGLPQITTRESGDVVLHEQTGLLIPPNHPDALAAAIQRLHADRPLSHRLGQAGRQRILDHFTWDHFRHRLLHAYDRAIQLATP